MQSLVHNQKPTWDQMPSYLHYLSEKLGLIEERLNTPTPKEGIEAPIDIEEAAQFIKKEVPTIYTLVQKRKIPSHRQGKKLYFFKTELVEWIKAGDSYDPASQEAEDKFLAANAHKKRRP
jgi:excisionase family DNA binding protein